MEKTFCFIISPWSVFGLEVEVIRGSVEAEP